MIKLPQHIRDKITIIPDGCWEWQGELSSNGYGRAWYKGIRSAAHRIVYLLLVGGIIEGKQLDHKCNNRKCVNPFHLQPMTGKKNCLLREKRRRKREREAVCCKNKG